jgi:hypothetical protein
MGDYRMNIGSLTGYIASGFCFMIVVLANIVALPSLYSEKGFVGTVLGVLFLAGSFAFTYLLGRGGV